MADILLIKNVNRPCSNVKKSFRLKRKHRNKFGTSLWFSLVVNFCEEVRVPGYFVDSTFTTTFDFFSKIN